LIKPTKLESTLPDLRVLLMLHLLESPAQTLLLPLDNRPLGNHLPLADQLLLASPSPLGSHLPLAAQLLLASPSPLGNHLPLAAHPLLADLLPLAAQLPLADLLLRDSLDQALRPPDHHRGIRTPMAQITTEQV